LNVKTCVLKILQSFFKKSFGILAGNLNDLNNFAHTEDSTLF